MNRRDFIRVAGPATVLLGTPALWPRTGQAEAATAPAVSDTIPLSGPWRFHLDPENVGREFTAWNEITFRHDIDLPASTDEAGYGTQTTGPEFGHLSREWRYQGKAWYQREVDVPEDWRGKHVTLFLERPHWATTVWIDDQQVGTDNSLSVPHVHDLSGVLTPGRHRLTIEVDNRYLIDVGRNAHSVTDHTQTNWNGITGRIELRATDPVWIDRVRTFPDVDGRRVRVEGTLRNATGARVGGEVSAVVTAPDGQVHRAATRVRRIGEEAEFAVDVDLGDEIATWDEFSPALYRAEVALTADDGTYVHRERTTFGMREIAADGTRLKLNGHPVFLRGTLECCIFPKTGYPPTDEGDWTRLYEIARSYGLNHFRFHSYCPPEAAFAAADRMGFMLHVETPVWSHAVGQTPELDAYMLAEAHRIQDTYGNHPSFTMMALGNELEGDWDFVNETLAGLKQRDPRHLYTSHADYTRMHPEPESEYYVAQRTAMDQNLRIHLSDRPERPFGTDFDFTDFVDHLDLPVVAHELGQWVVNPDYSELDKYTGPLKPRNLAAFRDRLAARGMLDQARAMQQATGRFSWLLYKEEMEAAFRTPAFGGFQLLQLQDFPGQGEALIGLLDAFWGSKGLVPPAEFRQFCSATVPLMRTERFVWTAGETFEATAQVNHHGPAPLRGAATHWVLRTDDGTTLGEGTFDGTDVGYGVTTLGDIRVPLTGVQQAQHATLTVSLPAASATNDWDLWIYPESINTAPPEGVLVTDRLDDAARRALARGGRVVVLSPPEERGDDHLEMRFLPVFWSLSWFPDQPGHNSILCDPAHPALAAFPTDFHTNWQWQELVQPAKAFVLDDASPDYRPVVQVVDDFHRNHKLAAVFETKVGAGRLLATSLNLQGAGASRPAARQMLHSLMAYARSDDFAPDVALEPALLDRLLG